MGGCKGHQRHWFTAVGEVGNQLSNCRRCGAPNPRDPNRLPTEFETKVLRYMTKPDYLRALAGNNKVAISAACRRLEKMGYAAKPGTSWWVTDKGEEYLKATEAKSD